MLPRRFVVRAVVFGNGASKIDNPALAPTLENVSGGQTRPQYITIRPAMRVRLQKHRAGLLILDIEVSSLHDAKKTRRRILR